MSIEVKIKKLHPDAAIPTYAKLGDAGMDLSAVDMNWDEDMKAGDYLVFECYSVIDPEVYTEIYNDILLKKYFTATVKRQWGANLSKFEGIQLPGGVQFNGNQLFEQAQQDIEKFEEEVQLRYELPIDFHVG